MAWQSSGNNLNPRLTTHEQIESELENVLQLAEATKRKGIVERLRELQSFWQGYSQQEYAREAREAAVRREVDRVDRAAARMAIQTERLRRQRFTSYNFLS